MNDRWKEIIENMRKEYISIFNTIYPSKGSTGFTERNLTVNFSNAYKKCFENAVVWYEFPFGDGCHYDAVIVNPDKMEIIVVEAKRFSNPAEKIKSINNDIDRIMQLTEILESEFCNRLYRWNEYSVVGVLVADVWAYNAKKIIIRDSFVNNNFEDKLFDSAAGNLRQVAKNCIECTAVGFKELLNLKWIKEEYNLITLIWKVK